MRRLSGRLTIKGFWQRWSVWPLPVSSALSCFLTRSAWIFVASASSVSFFEARVTLVDELRMFRATLLGVPPDMYHPASLDKAGGVVDCVHMNRRILCELCAVVPVEELFSFL